MSNSAENTMPETSHGINNDNSNRNAPRSAPPRLLPLLQKTKDAYLLWYSYYQILPKLHRHSLGQKVDTLFVEIIEMLAIANFLIKEEKIPYVRVAIRKTDTLKIFLMMLWETKSLDDKKYIALSIKIDEIGKMLGGWNGQLTKQNPPAKWGGK
ncbi:MAG: four helix bundle protein [Patescibacteria group bacterium]|nr:four helix bundle protein [Patescibacteria group bacterium]